MIRRLPIRVRLALGFALLMAIVLGGTGLFVYDRTRSDLDRQLEQELSVRLTEVVAIVRDDGDDLGDPVHDPLGRIEPGALVQVVDQHGEVVDATSEQLGEALLGGEELLRLRRAEGATVDVDPAGSLGALRLVAERTQDDGVQYTVVVGASLAEREQALSSLSRLLLIGGPIALLLASLGAYGVAAAALRPVDSMRARAAEISEDEPGGRLPVPDSKDEIAALGTTLNAMLGRLEEAIDRERRFVADASHELRTPLAILRTEVDLALESGRSPAELRAALSSIGDETDRLVRLAGDMLIIARADAGRLPVAIERIRAEELLRRVAAGRREGLALDVAAGLEIDADPLRIEQALGNLVGNALAYGGGEVGIAIRTAGERVELHVLDRGPGFSESLLPEAFERFTRGSESGPGGAGLGLGIVKAIAVAHGGSVHARNREGGGADVWISLPWNGASAA